MTMDK